MRSPVEFKRNQDTGSHLFRDRQESSYQLLEKDNLEKKRPFDVDLCSINEPVVLFQARVDQPLIHHVGHVLPSLLFPDQLFPNTLFPSRVLDPSRLLLFQPPYTPLTTSALPSTTNYLRVLFTCLATQWPLLVQLKIK